MSFFSLGFRIWGLEGFGVFGAFGFGKVFGKSGSGFGLGV